MSVSTHDVLSVMSLQRRFLVGFAVAASAGCSAIWFVAFRLETHRVFERPDGAYRVIVLRRPVIVRMPGQAADAPGIVRLVDRDGHPLGEVGVWSVEEVEEVDWSRNRAYIRFIADWPLP